jgi:hypothetical protein
MNPDQLDKLICAALKDGRRSLAELADTIREDARFILRRLHVLQGNGKVLSDKGETCLVYWLSGVSSITGSTTAADKPESEKAPALIKRRKAIIVQSPITIPLVTVALLHTGSDWVKIECQEPGAKDEDAMSVLVLRSNVPLLIEALKEVSA